MTELEPQTKNNGNICVCLTEFKGQKWRAAVGMDRVVKEGLLRRERLDFWETFHLNREEEGKTSCESSKIQNLKSTNTDGKSTPGLIWHIAVETQAQ